jgi:2-polyprenyl-3-methyl-5-hydroxy-6-metoxy-1,4-benzoquinol methylase
MSRKAKDDLEVPPRQLGDRIAIPGDYQARALSSRFAAQRFWHEAQFRLIERIACPQASDVVLDAGCGSGTISKFLAGYSASVVGIDSNPDAIEFASRTYAQANLEFLLGYLDELPQDRKFDCIYCIEVLEHMHMRQAVDVLIGFRRLAKAGARLLLTTPHKNSLWPVIEWALDKAKLVPHLSGDQHLSCYSKSEIRRACEMSRWKVVEIGTFNGLAPFASHVSYNGALRLEALEMKFGNILPGNLVFCLCRAE